MVDCQDHNRRVRTPWSLRDDWRRSNDSETEEGNQAKPRRRVYTTFVYSGVNQVVLKYSVGETKLTSRSSKHEIPFKIKIYFKLTLNYYKPTQKISRIKIVIIIMIMMSIYFFRTKDVND